MAQPSTSAPIAREGDRAAAVPSGLGETLWMWLACLVFYYPLFWLSNSLMWAAPAFLRVAFAGEQLNGVRLTSLGAQASSNGVGASGIMSFHDPARDVGSLALAAGLVLLITVLLTALGKKVRVLSGLVIAVVADCALLQSLGRRLVINRLTPEMVLASAFFFTILCFGLRRMLEGFSAQRAEKFLGRFGILLSHFVLLPVIPWAWFALTRRFSLWPFALLLMVPGAVAALLVSVWPIRRPARPAPRAGQRALAAGIAAFALMIAGVRAGQSAIERAQRIAAEKAMAAYPPIPVDAPYPKIFFQKGVSVSAEGWGGYESDSARRTLETLRQYGVDAVAIVPYGFEERGQTEVHLNTGAGSWESDRGLEAMSRVAHSLGMKVLLKPGIWVGAGGYAGQLDFPLPADRARWFESYTRFTEHYAQLAATIHADVFCIGGEFEKLTPKEAAWRKLIARVRELYPGPLVYAANFGTEFESVRFWDALDYIGLQDYYPLPDDLSTDEVERKVEAVQKKFQRPVIFTEAGFPSREGANRDPWEDGHGEKLSLDLQARCYQALFKAFYDKPWFEGMYWWKVGTNTFGGPEDTSLTPWGKPAMEVVKRWYTRPKRQVNPKMDALVPK
jgi:Glycoside Hydrolase Family 113